MNKNNTLKIVSLSFVPVIMVLGNSMLIPVLADLKRELHIHQYEANLLISYFSFPAAILIPFLGFLSDRIGRKKILVPSLIVYGLGGVISGIASIFFASPYPYILLGRIIQGLGAAGTSPMAMILISDMFSSEERSEALGIIEASNGIGKVISPILGSIIALFAWYIIFFSYSFLTIPIALLIWFVIDEDKNMAERKPLKTYVKEIMMITKYKRRPIFICFFIGWISLFVLYGILANLSEVMDIKESLLKKGLFVALPLLSMSIISFWLGGYLKNKEHLYSKMMIVGLILCIVGSSFIFYFPIKLYNMILLQIIGIGVGMILTVLNTFVTSCVPKGKRGIITACYNSFRFFGISFGPIYFYQFHQLLIKRVLMVFILLVMVILFILYVKSHVMMEYFQEKKQ
ncbi:MFS transporter [Inediibacterium massiliense]|uniref:MFS transporter n=1 Tax=Inediibacterium massiliense TaxID=1658111 RepID=UPI0006B4272D|nr:MFS transporter [Inediibacterium massiliense]